MATITLTRPDLPDDAPNKHALVIPLTNWKPPRNCPPIVRKEAVTNSCGPPEMLSVWKYGGYYSPAICPEGYTTACTRFQPDEYHMYPIEQSQTVASCVPRCGISATAANFFLGPLANGKIVAGAASHLPTRTWLGTLPIPPKPYLRPQRSRFAGLVVSVEGFEL
jgi:hypothetical protein